MNVRPRTLIPLAGAPDTSGLSVATANDSPFLSVGAVVAPDWLKADGANIDRRTTLVSKVAKDDRAFVARYINFSPIQGRSVSVHLSVNLRDAKNFNALVEPTFRGTHRLGR